MFVLMQALIAVAFAFPTLPQTGSYAVKGKVEAFGRMRQETLHHSTQQDRLRELAAKGFTCTNMGRGFFSCTGFERDVVVTSDIQQQAQVQASTLRIQFQTPRGGPELTRNGQSIQEWSVPQAVVTPSRTYDGYRFLRGQGVERIFLGEPAEQSLVVHDFRMLSAQLEVPAVESSTVRFRYLFRAYLVLQ